MLMISAKDFISFKHLRSLHRKITLTLIAIWVTTIFNPSAGAHYIVNITRRHLGMEVTVWYSEVNK